jgi:PP-loop superfamily ATP-utilizing enzyme
MEQTTGRKVGQTRKVKTLLGELKLKAKQLQRLALKPRSRLSPLLQKCCLRLSAKESYQKAEVEIEALTGVKVGHRTQQKLVVEQDWELPQAKQAVCEVSMDSVKV